MAEYPFTEPERHAINEVQRKIDNDETLTSDEAVLYARFQAYSATNRAEFEAEQKRRDERNQAKIEVARAESKEARENMNALAAAALERYERTLGDGQ